MDLFRFCLKAARKTHGALVPRRHVRPDLQGQAAGDLIRNTLASNQPCMISRFGDIELATVLTFLAIRNHSLVKRSLEFIRGHAPFFWWDKQLMFPMSNNAGFFPANEVFLSRFAERMLEDIPHIDVLGSWLPGETRLIDLMSDVRVIPLGDFEPYRHERPWSEALAGKKILVIHPFEDSICTQYAKRRLLFTDPRVLPDFELVTLKSVQSITQAEVGFASWFDALDWMCERIDGVHFDIALIGAGAYGLPLAAHVKRYGKKAVHLGGATQILFGIKGKRFDGIPSFRQLYNEHWVRPLPSETPADFQLVEGGAYW